MNFLMQSKIYIIIFFFGMTFISNINTVFANDIPLNPESSSDIIKTAPKKNYQYHLDFQFNAKSDFSENVVLKTKHYFSQFTQNFVTIWSGYEHLLDDTNKAIQRLSNGKGFGYILYQFIFFTMLLVFAFTIEIMFYRLLEKIKHQHKKTMPTCIGNLFTKILARTLVDVGGLAVFGLFIFLGFILFFPANGPLYEITITYMPEVFLLRMIYILLKIIYSPKEPHMRIAPQNCPSSGLYFLGILSFIIFTITMKQTLFLLRTNELNSNTFLLYYSIIGLTQFIILSTIMWKDRTRITKILMKNKAIENGPAGIDTSKTHKNWIIFGFLVLICFEFLWQLNLILFKKDLTLPLLLTILSLPFGYLIFSIGNRLLLIASGKTELLDPRIVNKDILKPGMDMFAMLNLEKPLENQDQADTEDGVPILEPFLPALKKILITLITLMISFWVFDLWGFEIPLGIHIIKSATILFITLLCAYIFWEVSQAYIDAKIKEEIPNDDGDGDPEGSAGGSRKATILTLVKRFLLTGLVITVFLILLRALGIDIGPLLAGAGILGIAIGFGSQALVKDILSGLFFLIDDAFRVGDYIETSGVKGAVQEISLRSVKVRHPRGMLFTIPYGSMGSIQNFSRDYIITKLDLRVRYDANIDKIRKIIKKINKVLVKDEEIGPTLLSKIKSQGVREMDDSAMILRVKFKTIPGEQFIVRRKVYQMIQEAFKDNNIEFAHKNVTVYLPEETNDLNSENEKLLKTGAAAAAIENNKSIPAKT